MERLVRHGRPDNNRSAPTRHEPRATMTLLTDAVRAYIGASSQIEFSCDAVERGAVRRYAQAIMDDDPVFMDEAAASRFGGAVAPLLFPTHMFRRAFGAPDPLQARANDPDFDGVADGIGATAAQGLPEIEPLRGLRLMNGGSAFEFYRHAQHGERVTVRSCYTDIVERSTSQGPMVLVTVESEFRTASGALLLKVRTTLIRR